jgi:predicted dehydrogenase
LDPIIEEINPTEGRDRMAVRDRDERDGMAETDRDERGRTAASDQPSRDVDRSARPIRSGGADVSAPPLGVAIVGCGGIARAYGDGLTAAAGIALRGAWDRNPPRVRAFAERHHGAAAFGSLDELLGAPDIDAVVNLTRQTSHAELTARCLQAGKHVYSEKPLAMAHDEARALVDLAVRNDVRLACAPTTFLGEAQRTAWRMVRDGRLGNVRVIYAEANWGRIERWHPRPLPFYDVGPTVDVGVYPLTLVTAMVGPARRVWARGEIVLPERTTAEGDRFGVTAPDFAVAVVELECGALMRLTTSFYVERASKQQGIELHGDLGSIALDGWHRFDAVVEHAPAGEPYQPVALDEPPYAGVDYARGVAELAAAIAADRPHGGTGEHAAHVVEIIEAIHASARDGLGVELTSGFRTPELDP